MKKLVALAVAACISLALFANASYYGAKATPGKALVEKSCVGCHKNEVYTAATRKIASLSALREQIEACANAAKAGWTDAEKAEVVEYLNMEFYKFK